MFASHSQVLSRTKFILVAREDVTSAHVLFRSNEGMKSSEVEINSQSHSFKGSLFVGNSNRARCMLLPVYPNFNFVATARLGWNSAEVDSLFFCCYNTDI